jgi:hypothetical protein
MLDFTQNGLPVGSVDLDPHVLPLHQDETAEQASGRAQLQEVVQNGACYRAARFNSR